jgi:RNA recognition motif-containing protein
MVKLFVVGFPRSMDELALAQLFALHGDIELLTIVRDKFSGVSKGFGFVQMKDAIDARQAMEALDGFAIGDRKLEVRLADDKLVSVKPKLAPHGSVAVQVRKKRPRLLK